METEKRIKVWDPFVRIFHWGLVTTFFIAYITEEDLLLVHTLAGYILMGLIALRLVWGFIGTQHARFSDFTYTPRAIRRFLGDTLRLRARRYIGHNPAGGMMIYLLLISLLLTSFSGLIVYGAEGEGPLAIILSGSSPLFEEVFEELHEFLANFTLLLVFLHVIGVVFESFIHQENLVASMFHGFKRMNGEGKS